jgi:hypothetical protein
MYLEVSLGLYKRDHRGEKIRDVINTHQNDH